MAQEDAWEGLVAAGQTAFQAGNYEEAEEKFTAALEIAETFSELDTRLATTLNNIAAVHYINNDYVAAEPLFRRALSIRERSLGRDHVEVATSLNNLAAVYRKQGDKDAAVPALERALQIREGAFGPAHPSVLSVLENLAGLHRDLSQDAPAEALLRQSLDRRQTAEPRDAVAEAEILERLASIQQDAGRYGEAAESLTLASVRRRDAGLDAADLEPQIAAMRDMLRADDPEVAAVQREEPPVQATVFPEPGYDLPVAAEQATSIADDPHAPKQALAALPGATETEPQPAVNDAVETEVAAIDNATAIDEPIGVLFYLQLVSLKSKERAESEWLRLQDSFDDLLGDLSASVVRAELGDHGVWYRLQAGPFSDYDVAEATCASLTDQEQACLIVER